MGEYSSRSINRKRIIKERPFCSICGFNVKEILHVHHIVPVSKGGSNSNKNLMVLCPNCHSVAHKMNSNIKDHELGSLVNPLLKNDYTIKQIKKLKRIIL